MPTVTTWLYTLDADGASVRMPITLRTGHAPMIDDDAVEPYHEPPLRSQMPIRFTRCKRIGQEQSRQNHLRYMRKRYINMNSEQRQKRSEYERKWRQQKKI